MTDHADEAAPARASRRPIGAWPGLRISDIGHNPQTARSRIVRVVVVALVALALLISSGVVGLVLLRHRVMVLASEIEPQAAVNRQIRVTLNVAQSALRGYTSTGDRNRLGDYTGAVPALNDQMATLSRLSVKDDHMQQLAQAQERVIGAWIRDFGNKIVNGEINRTDNVQLTKSSDAFAIAVRANDAIVADLHDRTEALVRRSKALTTVAIIAILTIGLLGMVLVAGQGARALRVIGPPLESLYRTVRALRGGASAARANPDRGVLEVRAVASVFNELADSNQSAHELLSERLSLSEFVHRMQLQMNADLEMDHVVDRSLQPIAEQFTAARAWIRTWDGSPDLPGDGRRMHYPDSGNVGSSAILVAASQRLAQRCWERQVCYRIGRDHPVDETFISRSDHEGILGLLASAGAGSAIVVPIGDVADCFGYLALARHDETAEWNLIERDALQEIGRDLGRTIRHVRILQREQQLVAELQALDVKKREFVSMVSHELRTPLSAIIGHLELVRSGDLGVVAKEMEISLGAMARNSTRLTRLIEDLLLISRIEESDDPTTMMPLDLSRLAADVVVLHAEAARRKSITVNLAADSSVPVLGDPDELDRMISNLLGNAIKYSPPNSSIELTVSPEPDEARLVVADHGMGISASDQQQLFTRFFRSTNPAALLVPGTGLGLAITKLIAQKHRGEIAVTSQEGVGTTFTVRLPSSQLMQRLINEDADGDAESPFADQLPTVSATAAR